MKDNRLQDALNNISDQYIEEAHQPNRVQAKRFSFTKGWFPKLAMGLCAFALVIVILPGVAGNRKSNMASDGVYELHGGVGANATDQYYSQNAGNDYAKTVETEQFGRDDGFSSQLAKQNQRKLIITANLTMSCDDIETATEAIKQLALKAMGYVQNEVYQSNAYSKRTFSCTLRVPRDGYADFVSELKQYGNISYFSEDSQDVTDSYVDIEARLNVLKAERDQVMAFYKEAANVEELIKVEARLSELQQQIEGMEAQLKNYDLLSDYATINLTLEETAIYVVENPSFAQRLAMEFKNGWNNFVEDAQELVLALVYNIWNYLILAAVVAIAIVIAKKKGWIKGKKKHQPASCETVKDTEKTAEQKD